MTFIENLQALLQINTEFDEATVSKQAPYGAHIARGLRYVESLAQSDGFETRNIDNKALAIVYGDQPQRVEATSHIDVVPAVGTWTHPPYSATLVDNRMYARGSQDMKTQILLTYYALKEIRQEKIPLKRQIRLVIGTDEEQSMQDIAHYLTKEGLPDFAFTPDASFPVCLGEKGAVSWQFSRLVNSKIKYIKAGTAGNVIPDSLFMILEQDTADALLPKISHEDVRYEQVGDEYHIHISGKSAHTSTPEKGDNVIVKTLNILKDLTDEAWVHQLHSAFYDYYGEGIHLDPRYEPMGYASVCLNVLELSDNVLRGAIDIRYPNPLTSVLLENKLKLLLKEFQLDRTFDESPIETNLSNPFVIQLLNAYTKHFPDDDSQPYYSGGVTYSKVYQGRCVAFGARLPFSEQESLAHQIDEYVVTDYFPQLIQIYKDALIGIANC